MIGVNLVDLTQGLRVTEHQYRVLTLNQCAVEGISLARFHQDICFDGHFLAWQVGVPQGDGLGEHVNDRYAPV